MVTVNSECVRSVADLAKSTEWAASSDIIQDTLTVDITRRNAARESVERDEVTSISTGQIEATTCRVTNSNRGLAYRSVITKCVNK